MNEESVKGQSGVSHRLETIGHTCTECGRCMPRCEVLFEPDVSIGTLARRFDQALEGDVETVRRCFLCGRCTVTCPVDISAQHAMELLREYYMQESITTTAGFETVLVDTDNLFKAYRDYFNISYTSLPYLENAEKGQADTLFFPGCTLATYLPELTEAIGTYLGEQGISAAISVECCGSPLKSLGLTDRADALLQRVFDDIERVGITRVVTVCPGCHEFLERFAEAHGYSGIAFVPLARIMDDADVKADKEAFEGLSFIRFDSCHDRRGLFLEPIANMFEGLAVKEFPCSGCDTVCCGSGGLVSSVTPKYSDERTEGLLREAHELEADVIITSCPTCSYAFAGAIQRNPAYASVRPILYLELLFGWYADWNRIYANLSQMWMDVYA